MRRSMSRKLTNCLSPVRNRSEEVAIEGSWTLALNKKAFLLHQESQIRKFAADEGLKLAKVVLSDCFFKTVTQPFVQFYSFFGAAKEWKLLVERAFLGAKIRQIYTECFHFLVQKSMEKFGVPLVPEMIITDYETGIIPAVGNLVLMRNTLVAGSTTRNAFTENFKLLDFHNRTRETLNLKESPEGCSAFHSYHQTKSSVLSTIIAMNVAPTFYEQPALETLFAYVEHFWIWGQCPSLFECI